MVVPIVEFQGIIKQFPGVLALNNVSLSVSRGSCHGLVGENGAGKSTLGKVLAGIHVPEKGRILIDGKPVRINNPVDALKAGIGMVHQELAFCENMTIGENLCLGIMPAVGPFVNRKKLEESAKKQLAAIGAEMDINRRLGELTIGQQQIVQIAAAVGRGARILVFDEPTSSLSQAESQRLFDLIKKLQADGTTAIYVSHRLEEIFQLCDMVSVLRDGQLVATKPIEELDEASLISLMIGRPFEAYYPSYLESELGDELLRVENLSSPGKFDSVSFSIRAGEILGFAGLVGSGRTEVAEALFGLDKNVHGSVYIKGELADISGKTTAAMDMGLGLVPEDRKRHGLVLMMTSRENITLPTLPRYAVAGWVNRRAEESVARKYFDLMRIRATNIEAVAASLSGGNQQKLVLAKWLAADCSILLVDEPTRGVDVGAKAEIHSLIDELASKGSAILLISSELPEVLNLSSRILVFRHGRVAGELQRREASQDAAMRLMAGVTS